MFMCSQDWKTVRESFMVPGNFRIVGFNVHPSIKNTLGIFYVIGTGQTVVNKIKQEKVPIYTYGGDRDLIFFSNREDRQ